jgi:5'-methylthioadenosine phosphorylase
MDPQHIKAKPGDVSRKVVISGDPARVTQLSTLLGRPRLVNENRGFLTYTGEYEGEELTVACHGIGGPSAAIVIEELVMLGAKAIVRLGSCGGLLRPMRVGDLVIATGAGYASGTLDSYLGRKITPRPDGELTELLSDLAGEQKLKYHRGRVFSSDAFYAGGPDFTKRLAREGYIAIEMECATLFGLGKLRRVKTASVLLVSDNAIEGAPIVDADALRRYAKRAGEMVFGSLCRFTP